MQVQISPKRDRCADQVAAEFPRRKFFRHCAWNLLENPLPSHTRDPPWPMYIIVFQLIRRSWQHSSAREEFILNRATKLKLSSARLISLGCSSHNVELRASETTGALSLNWAPLSRLPLPLPLAPSAAHPLSLSHFLSVCVYLSVCLQACKCMHTFMCIYTHTQR